MHETYQPVNALDELAAKIGIEEGFTDAKGERQETSAETKRALLRAMGITAETDREALDALRTLDAKDWGRSLPPVRVSISNGEPVEVEVVVPGGGDQLSWRVELENGGERAGSVDLRHRVPVANNDQLGRSLVRYALLLDTEIPHGYHRLRTNLDDAICLLIVTPGRCWLPKIAEKGRRLWGVAAQLYLLQSQKNGGSAT